MASKSSKAEKTTKNTTAKKAAVAEPVKAPERVLHKARLTFWSYYITCGFNEMKFKDFMKYGPYEYESEYCNDFSGFDLADLEGELEIDGKPVPIDFNKICAEVWGGVNCWCSYWKRSGVYYLEVDKTSEYAEFSFEGDFDPKKLTLYYSEAIYPEHDALKLLNFIEYDGEPLTIKEPDEFDNKGTLLWFFRNNKYSEISDLKTWTPMPFEGLENPNGI
jgi:hypothetical protein